MNILVLCTGNSARSILLECLLRRLGAGRINAYSAGSQPAGRVHPEALLLLNAEGYETAALASKSWDVFGAPGAPRMDVVITVCGSAAEETCPIWPGTPLRAHWGVEDPAHVASEEAPQAFRTAYEILSRRAAAFLAAPVETMSPAALQTHLDTCGRLP